MRSAVSAYHVTVSIDQHLNETCAVALSWKRNYRSHDTQLISMDNVPKELLVR